MSDPFKTCVNCRHWLASVVPKSDLGWGWCQCNPSIFTSQKIVGQTYDGGAGRETHASATCNYHDFPKTRTKD